MPVGRGAVTDGHAPVPSIRGRLPPEHVRCPWSLEERWAAGWGNAILAGRTSTPLTPGSGRRNVGEGAATLLALGLNPATTRVPLNPVSAWVRASPPLGCLSLDAEKLTPRSFEEVLSALCHLASRETWEDRD